MAIVVDASISASWFLPDEATPQAKQWAIKVLDGTTIAPGLYWHEMRNLLVMALRRKRLDKSAFDKNLVLLDELPVRDTGNGQSAEICRLAIKHNLTSYDATYLALALNETATLATLDRKLRAAALAENVTLLPPQWG
jgi:predicted nucleic acid-binding protein